MENYTVIGLIIFGLICFGTFALHRARIKKERNSPTVPNHGPNIVDFDDVWRKAIAGGMLPTGTAADNLKIYIRRQIPGWQPPTN